MNKCMCCGLETEWLKRIQWSDNDIEIDFFCHKCFRWALSADKLPGLFNYDLNLYLMRVKQKEIHETNRNN